MGYGFMVWAVDTDKLKHAAGSKDEKLRRMIGGRFKRNLASLDELFEGTGAPSAYEALKQIVDGTVPDDVSNGAVYRYAFKLLVEHFGRPLSNGPVCPWNSPDFGPVNAVFAAMNVPFKLDRLYGTSLPIKLPYPDDFPMSGWVDAEEAKAIDAAFTAAGAPNGSDEAGEIAACVRGWFREAATSGRGLVSYYH
jgi:hypothetical protein